MKKPHLSAAAGFSPVAPAGCGTPEISPVVLSKLKPSSWRLQAGCTPMSPREEGMAMSS